MSVVCNWQELRLDMYSDAALDATQTLVKTVGGSLVRETVYEEMVILQSEVLMATRALSCCSQPMCVLERKGSACKFWHDSYHPNVVDHVEGLPHYSFVCMVNVLVLQSRTVPRMNCP